MQAITTTAQLEASGTTTTPKSLGFVRRATLVVAKETEALGVSQATWVNCTRRVAAMTASVTTRVVQSITIVFPAIVVEPVHPLLQPMIH